MLNCNTIYVQINIFLCSKNYGSQTRVASLKVGPNVADPTSMKHTVSSLNYNKTESKTANLTFPGHCVMAEVCIVPKVGCINTMSQGTRFKRRHKKIYVNLPEKTRNCQSTKLKLKQYAETFLTNTFRA